MDARTDLDPHAGASPSGEHSDASGDREIDGFDDGDDVDTPENGSGPAGLVRFFAEWGLVLVIALAVAVGVRVFIFSPFYIPSESMQPTLQINDRILVNKLSYKAHDVHRGDVIVFDAPPKVDFGPNVKDLVKRVIAISGDRVTIANCVVSVNGKPLVEPYVAKDAAGRAVCTTGFERIVDPRGEGTVTVPAGDVLVMGDNRNNSFDGRKWGFLDEKLIVGRAFVIYWPVGHWSWL